MGFWLETDEVRSSCDYISSYIGNVLVCNPDCQWGRCGAGDDHGHLAQLRPLAQSHTGVPGYHDRATGVIFSV